MDRSYDAALALLAKLESNRTVTTLFTSASSADLNARAIPEILAWLSRAGYGPSDLARLRCIHVAGTKGKGSVCAYATSLLRKFPSAGRVGTYTSPHLVSVRERIAIDGEAISQAVFARYFFEVWERLSDAARKAGDVVDAEGGVDGPATKPFYFRFLTIMAWHVFLSEGVKSAVVECGIGGEYDATNVLPPEAVSASVVAQLGIDHVAMLGGTVEEIAWHKAGVFKTGVPAFTRRVDEQPGMMAVLRERAKEKRTMLTEIPDGEVGAWGGIEGRLGGDFQKYNQALAIAAVRTHLGMSWEEGRLFKDLPEAFISGLKTAHLRGRHEVLTDGNAEWFLNGAHTSDSLAQVAKWFAAELGDDSVSILVFNQQDRDATKLLTRLFETIEGTSRREGTLFDHALFTRNDQTAPAEGEAARDLSVQTKTAEAMSALSAGTRTAVFDNIEAAVEEAKRISEEAERSGKRVKVLGTGSLYLVGGLLRALEPDSLL